jgi:putative Mn2+ efflux pump MntP
VVWLSLLSLALALSMDAMAVSAARALSSSPSTRVRDALWMGLAFGGAQAVMPLLGWWLGAGIGTWLSAWDHWIACVLLVGIGAKMVREAFSHDDEDDATRALTLGALLLLALATSIDSFAAGITLPTLGLPLAASVVTIGAVTATLSFACAWFSRAIAAQFGEQFGKALEVTGGVVLMLLGVKVLLEHTLLQSTT